MAKKITAYKVDKFKDVRLDRYIEGDIFITKTTTGILVDGKIRNLQGSKPNMKDYVKKEDVKKLIEEYLTDKKEGEPNEKV